MLTTDAVASLVRPFLEEQPDHIVWLALCCGRLYAGRGEPKACRTCPNVPRTVSVTSLDELPGAIQILTV